MSRQNSPALTSFLFAACLISGCRHYATLRPDANGYVRARPPGAAAGVLTYYRPVECNGQTGKHKETIKPTGGSVELSGGHRLIVPAGAVDVETEFYMTHRGGVPHRQIQIDRVPIHKDLTLVMSYEGCRLRPGEEQKLTIIRIGENGAEDEDVGPAVPTGNSAISVTLDHLSGYALAVPQ